MSEYEHSQLDVDLIEDNVAFADGVAQHTGNAAMWQKAHELAPLYFELVELPLSMQLGRDNIELLLVKLHESRDRVHVLLYSDSFRSAGECIFRSISDMVTGYAVLLAGDKRMATAYLRASRIEFEFAFAFA